ncbi:MAG: hypothetical protein GY787_04405 [Alteromonadales bacterium]|nr:hypothetical protein [Alteromonadales bacterium]
MYDSSYPPFYRYLVLVLLVDELKVLEFSDYDVAVSALKYNHTVGNEVALIDNIVPEEVPF